VLNTHCLCNLAVQKLVTLPTENSRLNDVQAEIIPGYASSKNAVDEMPTVISANTSVNGIYKENKKMTSLNPNTNGRLTSEAPVKEHSLTATFPEKNNTISVPEAALQLTFRIKFHTSFGQNLFILGNHPLLGNDDVEKAIPLKYINEEWWEVVIDMDADVLPDTLITYNYVLRNTDGTNNYDWGKDKFFNPASFKAKEILLIDAWNFAGYFENAFYTEPFQKVLLKANYTEIKAESPETTTHIFKVKSPLLANGQTLFISGNAKALKIWNLQHPILMSKEEGEDFYNVELNFTGESFPITYKYGVFDATNGKVITYEEGKNRTLYDTVIKNKQTLINDGFTVLPANIWKGAGIAIPVFALRTENSFGAGEFSDLKLLVDWSKNIGLKLIQLLPVNDTTATHSWTDSYPYAAISAFALHPIYLNLYKVADDKNKILLKNAEEERKQLNALESIDYVRVMNFKLNYIKQIYPSQKDATFRTPEFIQFFKQNQHWLEPYAVFCYLRDEYKTSDFNQWPAYRIYRKEDIAVLLKGGSSASNSIAIQYFIQYHLHLQLQEAKEYAHANGIVIKGDIAIGVYRYGADAWQQPELFRMEMQAGAPPDDFAVKGQNWSFPTYNWQRMKEDGFAWWKQRFEQMSYYFDAFRIDHILGFFRIWSIPIHAVEGIMGYFVPAIPVHVNEFGRRGIWFNYDRYVKPFINEEVLWNIFSYDCAYVKTTFLISKGFGNYSLQPEFDTQRKVEQHFSTFPDDDFKRKIRQGLYDLISNVILLEVEGSNGQQFHFRFAVSGTSSFKKLDGNTQNQLNDLYINYFFRRQDDFWMKEALQKLPALKRVTNMLVCGEDLGLVPTCVPELMRQLGLLSLEIQRMPKDPTIDFFNPKNAPYLSVVTPSTHDMSTIRGWWEEDRNRIQRFYNSQLNQEGSAPQFCEPWINKEIILQHLHSPAMWSIFQIQDLLGINGKLRRVFPNDERINVPADPKHYWRYRMHISLEYLMQQSAFNDEIKEMIHTNGR
jgi:4-alpha-glucanotransferase